MAACQRASDTDVPVKPASVEGPSEGMERRTRDIAVTVGFVALLCSALAFYGFVSGRTCPAGQGALSEDTGMDFRQLVGRQPAVFTLPTAADFRSGAFQDSIEEAASDNLPGSATAITCWGRLGGWLNRALLTPFPAEWVPAWPLPGGTLLLRYDERLSELPEFYTEHTRDEMIGRAAFYTALAARHRGVRIAIMPVVHVSNWIAESRRYFGLTATALKGTRCVREIGGLLGPGIAYSWTGRGLSPSAGMAMHYKTDHHLNAWGADFLYKQVLDLLPPPDGAGSTASDSVRYRTLPGVRFYGSIARKALGYTGICDTVEVADLDLPEMTVTVDGQPLPRTSREDYERGIIPAGRFYNHYGGCFGTDYGVVTYTCPSAPPRTLLSVGDSFDNCIEPMLASHYRTAYFVDRRHYMRDLGEPFDIDAFIVAKSVDDVLFIGR
jgi:hypothetical protein